MSQGSSAIVIRPINLIVIFIAFFLTFASFHSFYTVNSGTVGVLATFGRYSDDIKEPGLHFMIPFIQKVTILDVRMQTVQYEGKKDIIEKEGVIVKPQISILDSKNLGIGIELTVQFSPSPQEAEKILAKYGYNYFEKLINPIVRDLIRDVAGQYQAEEIALKRGSISEELREKLFMKFEDFPFTLNDVQLRNIDLPNIVRNKIEEVQLAKQEEQRLAMVEKQALKNQQIKTIEAETKLIEVTTNAKAEAEQKRIAAKAKAYQTLTEAEAQAKANIEIAKSITPELINYESIKRWSGHYPTTLIGDKGEMILQLPQAGVDVKRFDN